MLQKIVLALKELCLTCVLMHIYECAITIYTVIFTFSSFNYNHVTHVANIISLLRLHIYIHGCLLLPSTIYLHNIFNGIVGNKCYNELWNISPVWACFAVKSTGAIRKLTWKTFPMVKVVVCIRENYYQCTHLAGNSMELNGR